METPKKQNRGNLKARKDKAGERQTKRKKKETKVTTTGKACGGPCDESRS